MTRPAPSPVLSGSRLADPPRRDRGQAARRDLDRREPLGEVGLTFDR
ncbi:hypothetical protein SAMN02745121_03619 [Nannocystis exedens]|uniref:Uncharacterized protein n=1 Tax=Nannocystis exedens TaxID=54 RepID=A0A1I1Z7Z1_9BACT|nr:hypothetical protein [Nannocystis exedens]PCC75173.1 hypothetical protein NAEX_08279 [Nannocystis exedens]SFE26440.1 hypothetical protein SAMN02745121_03619 [Nannocystis exedens]